MAGGDRGPGQGVLGVHSLRRSAEWAGCLRTPCTDSHWARVLGVEQHARGSVDRVEFKSETPPEDREKRKEKEKYF